MAERLRAPVRYYGGKGNMIAKILPLFPLHHLYCEPFGGAASLLFAKQPAGVEVYNDLDGRIVNLFRCLQDKDKFDALQHRLLYALYSRAEFARAIEIDKDEQANEIDLAWATFVMLNQGFGGKLPPLIPSNWGRVFTSARWVASNNSRWLMRLSMLPGWHKRLLMVQIDCQDALKVIRYWDRDDALFYIDPPYVASTRKGRSVYRCEMTDEQHRALVETLLQVKGKVVLSGYEHPIYTALSLVGWRKIIFQTACYAAVRTRNSGLRGVGSALKKVPRTEVVWLNFPAINVGLLEKSDI